MPRHATGPRAATPLPGEPDPGDSPRAHAHRRSLGVLARRPLGMVAGALAVLAVAAGALVLSRRSAAGWTSRGDAFLRDSRLIDAENAYNRALQLDPGRPSALYGIGWAYLLAGLEGEARIRFQRCVEIAPGTAGCHRGLGALALSDGAAIVAERHLRRAWELAPDDAGVLSSLAELYTRAGRFEQAEDLYRRAIAREPDRGEYRIGLAEMMLARGDLDAAEGILDEAEQLAFREVRFRVGVGEIRARVALLRAEREGSTADGQVPSAERRERARRLLDRADALLQDASRLGLEQAALTRVRRGVERQREAIQRIEADERAAGGPRSP